jgi:hypothetical protein
MAIAAADYLKSAGPAKALAEFDKAARWHDRELYVIVLDTSGVMLAHGTNPSLLGQLLIDLKNGDGKPFEREIVAMKDAAWVDFKW